MCTINEKIAKLRRKTYDLRREVKDLKDALAQRNNLIIRLLSKGTRNQKEPIVAESPLPDDACEKKTPDFSIRFPLQNLEDLNKLELEINDDNKEYIVNVMRKLLLPQGILRNIGNVLSDGLIMETNVDGHHYKTRLLNFSKIIDVLFLATRKDDNYTLKDFLCDLRRSLRIGKNRCHKQNGRARQKIREEHEEQLKTNEIVKQIIIVKTEETYFPPCL